jgi:hypothetical protein
MSAKVAIVFGGARGIGAAIALRLAKDGFDVALTYVLRLDRAGDLVSAIEDIGRRAVAIQADSADPAAIRAAVTNAVEYLDALDAAVVSAGILRRASVEAFTLEDLNLMLDVNVRGVLVDRFNRAPREDDLPGTLEPEELARLLTSVMHGIASLGAAGSDGDQMRALADSMLNLWPDARTVRYETRLRLPAEFSNDQYHGRPKRQFLAFERPVRKASASRNSFSNRRAGRAPCPGKAKEDCHDQAHADQLTGLPLCAAGRYRAQGEGCGV